MDRGTKPGLATDEKLSCPYLQDGPAPLLDLLTPVGQLGEEVPQFFLHQSFGAQAQVRGDLFACPVPDGFGSIEIRTISRQAHQSQAQAWGSQAWGSQVSARGIAMMRRGIVPDHLQWSGVLIPQLLQESRRGLSVAIPLQFHDLHLAGLQTHRRVIAGLFAPPRAPITSGRWLSLEDPLRTHFPRRSASARKWASPAKKIFAPTICASARSAAYAATKSSRLASSALSPDESGFGRFRTNPNRCK